MMQDKIRQIINLAIHAPSGENCQPWRFELSGAKLDIFNLPERDQSLYSWGQRASLVAHGALIENIAIAAKFYALTPQITLFPEPTNQTKVATIIFNESIVETDPLFDFIKSRSSNRKPYKKDKLTEQEKSRLSTAGQLSELVKLKFADDQRVKDQLGFQAALNEKIIFENYSQHQFFFNHINWTKAEDEQKSIGFYIETLELPPPAKLIFKFIRHWKFMRLMNYLKFGNLVAKGNGKVNSAAAAFGAITIPNLDPSATLLAGRMFQRIWLTATSLGLQIQPLTGMLFLKLQVLAGEDKIFSPEHVSLINQTYQIIASAFHANPDEQVLLMFRIGRGEPASAHASRLAPIIQES